LTKANHRNQAKFMTELYEIELTRSHNGITVYIYEAHYYADADLRRMWAYKGEPALVPSSSPGRKKVNFYGAAAPVIGEFFLWEVERFNSINTAKFLFQLRERYPGRRIDLVWDNGTQHKGTPVKNALEKTNIHSHKLPGYSPELNSIEPLWHWFREEVTYNFCHTDVLSLRQNLLAKEKEFQNRPAEMKRRLKPDLSKIKHLLKPSVYKHFTNKDY
jgi:transposase